MIFIGFAQAGDELFRRAAFEFAGAKGFDGSFGCRRCFFNQRKTARRRGVPGKTSGKNRASSGI
jgi:hypothetical protein